jgi:hypothetical protein
VTVTDLLAEAARLLTANGYTEANPDLTGSWLPSNGRIFEDAYGVVGVVAYETWKDLEHGWPDAQASLGKLISDRVSRADPKSWEAYLVLLTPGVLGDEDRVTSQLIRGDTNSARKLLATGDELHSLANVERVLLPLLPLTTEVSVPDEGNLLDRLPELLDVEAGAVRTIVEAFRNQQPIIERLHQYLAR